MEWVILIGAVVVVGSIMLKVAQSLVSTAAVLLVVIALLVGTGLIHPTKMFRKQAESAKVDIQKKLQQLGCGEGDNKIVIGDANRCKTYQKARRSCARKSSAGSRSACRKRVNKKFNAETQDKKPVKKRE